MGVRFIQISRLCSESISALSYFRLQKFIPKKFILQKSSPRQATCLKALPSMTLGALFRERHRFLTLL